MKFESFWAHIQNRVATELRQQLPALESETETLYPALHYAVLNGGKRIRPLLLYATGLVVQTPLAHLDKLAAAIELIHSYSLVHDDLPAMDNDDVRRGQHTCHRAFGEATAILVGDALQTLAFEILANDQTNYFTATQRLRMIYCLAKASGGQGMVKGQALDMAGMKNAPSLEKLERVHLYKTGALLQASVNLAGLTQPTLEPKQAEHLAEYGRAIGLAYQVQDDILDVYADPTKFGKQVGGDILSNKKTFLLLKAYTLADESTKKILDQLLQKESGQKKIKKVMWSKIVGVFKEK
jgi:farnesyl diphosphate synthase